MNAEPAESSQSLKHWPVEEYWRRVGSLLQLPPGTRPSCRRLDAARLDSALEEPGWLQGPFAALDGSFWTDRKANISANWRWRARVPESNGPLTSEVSIERAIALKGGTSAWCCQMPTLSGFCGKYQYKRRSIDLVQRVSDTVYRFVELKTGADDVVYATFEILSYALTYLLARRYLAAAATGPHHVLNADHCDLIVLAPQAWYSRCSKESTRVLSQRVGDALRQLQSDDLPRMDLLFVQYRSDAGPDEIIATLEAACAIGAPRRI